VDRVSMPMLMLMFHFYLSKVCLALCEPCSIVLSCVTKV
jgi:hypothetical protein